MFKFLLYLFLIYFIVRFVFRSFTGPVIKVKTFHYHTHTTREPERNEDEGRVTIESVNENPKKGNDKNLGEYVDYEEVK